MSAHSSKRSTSKRLEDLNRSGEESDKSINDEVDIQSMRSSKINYESLREAITDLYLDVKIRSSEEIDHYDTNQFENERNKLNQQSLVTIVEYIKSSIEILMNMKLDENEPKSSQGYRPNSRPYFK